MEDIVEIAAPILRWGRGRKPEVLKLDSDWARALGLSSRASAAPVARAKGPRKLVKTAPPQSPP
ncbi:MAG: hypothetical protein WA231_16830 [Methylocella sp.]